MPTENTRQCLWPKFEQFSTIFGSSLKRAHNINLCFPEKGGKGMLRKTWMPMLCQSYTAGLLKQ